MVTQIHGFSSNVLFQEVTTTFTNSSNDRRLSVLISGTGGNGSGIVLQHIGSEETSSGPMCYTCTGKCVYDVVRLIFIFGICANFLVLWRTVADKKLRSPTFVAIACLALSDAMFLLLNMVPGSQYMYV
ncbi:hypothetical protein DPMN_128590 [Dreissena polymorpha]|uniref:G-protein coupled receptors family 1 profile domain-containing protein n=1 Tax=Dreissena polymorpha TaxID=45954 RepID=A0A9D4H394_DREPO|nr:hypothetical protein DPMN_128590 [Dreissena polymorpha]